MPDPPDGVDEWWMYWRRMPHTMEHLAKGNVSVLYIHVTLSGGGGEWGVPLSPISMSKKDLRSWLVAFHGPKEDWPYPYDKDPLFTVAYSGCRVFWKEMAEDLEWLFVSEDLTRKDVATSLIDGGFTGTSAALVNLVKATLQ
jgi:hypothetical protein